MGKEKGRVLSRRPIPTTSIKRGELQATNNNNKKAKIFIKRVLP